MSSRRFRTDRVAMELAALRGERIAVLRLRCGCNNRCGFCAAARTAPQDAPAELEALLAGDADPAGSQLVIAGAEPTLLPGLEDLVRRARQAGFAGVRLWTNARRCSYRSYAGALVRAGVTGAVVFMPAADAAGYGRISGVAEGFEQGLAGTDALARAGVSDLEWFAPVRRDNEARLPDLVVLASDRGVRRLILAGTDECPDPSRWVETLGPGRHQPPAGAPVAVVGVGYPGTAPPRRAIRRPAAPPRVVPGRARPARYDRADLAELIRLPPLEQLPRLQALGSREGFVFLGVGGYCLNHCIFCNPLRLDLDWGRRYRPLDAYREPISQLGPLGIRKVLLAGMEPLTYPHLFEILALIRAQGAPQVELMTCGEFLAADALCDELVAAGITSVSLGLYGVGQVHDDIVGTPDSFRMCDRGIERLRASGRVEVFVHALLMRQNLADLPALQRYVSDRGLPLAVINLRPKRPGDWYRSLYPPFPEIIARLAGSGLNLVSFPLCVLRRIAPESYQRLVDSGRDDHTEPLRRVERDLSDTLFCYSRFPIQKASVCRRCAVNRSCPGVFDQYRAAHGLAGIEPIEPGLPTPVPGAPAPRSAP